MSERTCGHGRLDFCVDCEVARLRSELERAERERDLAIAHDRQPYPTAWAYEQVCRVRTEWQARAVAAESRLSEVERALRAFADDTACECAVTLGGPCRWCVADEVLALSPSSPETPEKESKP